MGWGAPKSLKSLRQWPSTKTVSHANATLSAQGGIPQATSTVELVDEFLSTLSQECLGRTVAVYVERYREQPTVVRVAPTVSDVPVDGYSVELRFASWLSGIPSPQLRAVPTYLAPWLPVKRVLVLPLREGEKHRGAVVIDSLGLGRDEVARLESVVKNFILTLSREIPLMVTGTIGTAEHLATSMCRIKNAPTIE